MLHLLKGWYLNGNVYRYVYGVTPFGEVMYQSKKEYQEKGSKIRIERIKYCGGWFDGSAYFKGGCFESLGEVINLKTHEQLTLF